MDATLTQGDHMWSLATAVADTTYSDDFQATTTTETTKNNTVPDEYSTKASRLHFSDLQ